MPIALALCANRRGLAMHIEGCDKSRDATQFASELAASRGVGIRFFTLDILEEDLPPGFDVIISSLFSSSPRGNRSSRAAAKNGARRGRACHDQ